MNAPATLATLPSVAGDRSVPRRARAAGFDLVRLLAAGMVIYGHSFSLAAEAPPGWFGNGIATIGVKVFFVISGFLVTRSWMSDPTPMRFARRRALRIMPGLAVLILVTVVLLGPAFTTLGLAEYVAHPGTRLHLWNIALYPVYSLPGVFAANPYPAAVNGSLWSLPAEILMYLVTPLILGRVIGRGAVALLLATAIIVGSGLFYVRIAPPAVTPVFYGSSIVSVLDAAPYFLLGAVYGFFGLERYARPVLSTALLAAAAWGIQEMGARVNSYVWAECVLMLLLPFCVVSVGCQHIGRLDRVLGRTDLSYGLYLYGFPIQQMALALLGGGIGGLGTFAVALPFTIVCAALSWHLVERPALAWSGRRAA